MKNADMPIVPLYTYDNHLYTDVHFNKDRGAFIGLTKREYFAAMAMQGDWASQSETEGSFTKETTTDELAQRANIYVRAADGLLKALESE